MSSKDNTTTRREFLHRSATTGALGLAYLSSGYANAIDLASSPYNNIKGAERIMGIEYNDAERELISQGIEEQLKILKDLRAQNHSNNLATAHVFEPRLKGRTYADQPDDIVLKANNIPKIPNSNEAISYAPLIHLSHWIKTGQISSIKLTKLYLKRISQINADLHCFITVTEELSIKQAETADREISSGHYRGALHGIPFGVKDLVDTAGILTTWGAAPFKNRIAKDDAHIITLLREAGAVLLGKTSCGALAWGDVWFNGVTKNPWNLMEGSSGSSAGSASATAAGLVGFSIGTETWGSIISPASRCGVSGLRPTYGRIGRSGTMALCWSLDKIGPICRGVEDNALVLATLNGEDINDPANISHGFNYNGNVDLSGLTIGFDPSLYKDAHPLDKKAIDIAKNLGAKVVELTRPNLDVSALPLQLSAEAAAAFEELTLSGKDDLLRRQIRFSWPNEFRQARFISAVDLIQIDRLRRRLMVEMDNFFNKCDVFIGPNFDNEMNLITNYTGHPQLTFPIGFEKRPIELAYDVQSENKVIGQHLPRNISLWAPLFKEGQMIAVGAAIEGKLNLKNKFPPALKPS